MQGMSRRSVLTLSLALPALAAGLRPAAAQADSPSGYLRQFASYREEVRTSADYLPDVEAGILAETNAHREEAGVPILEPDEQLAWVARFYAHRLVDVGRIRHEDEAGRTPDQRIAILHRRQIGPNGENLFQTNLFRRSEPKRAAVLSVDSLMDSPGHRENILNEGWTHGGMGAVTDGTMLYVVQLFVRRTALLAEDAPMRLEPGRPLPTAATRFEIGSAELAALVPMGRNPDGPDLGPLARLSAPKTPGPYRLWYAMRRSTEGRRIDYDVNPGPIVEVGG